MFLSGNLADLPQICLKYRLFVFLAWVLDSLVLNLQLLHDGYFPGGAGVHDPNENIEKGLRQIQ